MCPCSKYHNVNLHPPTPQSSKKSRLLQLQAKDTRPAGEANRRCQASDLNIILRIHIRQHCVLALQVISKTATSGGGDMNIPEGSR